MVIAIIGAGLSGLVAANRLAQAGHEVTVFEKSRGFGGRHATRYAQRDKTKRFDHGAPYLAATTEPFKQFLLQLEKENILHRWTNKFLYRDEDVLTEMAVLSGGQDLFVASEGMNAVGKYLSRTVDVRTEVRVGGITYLGPHRGHKKAWMVNTDTQEVFEADAVVVAVPAVQAYGIIQTTQDETSVRRIIREIDTVTYDADLSVMLNYGKREIPEWKALIMQHPIVSLVVNESSKRDFGGELNLVVHTSPAFAATYAQGDREIALHHILKVLASELGAFASEPTWHEIHYWRYAHARTYLARPFFECDNPDQPLALIGDYFMGSGAEAAYTSAVTLSDHWIKSFQTR
jgi:hypothetical protein